MTDEDWQAGFAKSLGVYLDGRGIASTDERGEQILDDTFYVLFNAHHEPLSFTLPSPDFGERWVTELDTSVALPVEDMYESLKAGDAVEVEGRAVLVLRRVDLGG
jgi:glycogen operon protein